MSSIYSDPPFPRGDVLIGLDDPAALDSGNPVQGSDIVGRIKVFRDVNPSTGIDFSERLVYCVAVRAKQNGVANGERSNLTAGTVVKFAAGSLTELDNSAANSNLAAAGDTATIAGMVGVVDEYLPKAPLVNDVFWVVVKGPTTANVTTTAIANAGTPLAVSATAGSLAAASPATLGLSFFGVNLAAKSAGVLKSRVLVTNPAIA